MASSGYGPKVCIACGRDGGTYYRAPWIMGAVTKANHYGITLKNPAGNALHGVCETAFTKLLQNKIDREKQKWNSQLKASHSLDSSDVLSGSRSL